MVSDTYTVRFLVQATQDHPARVQWRERSGGGLATNVDGVEILLTEIQFRTAPRLALRFRHRDDEFWLYCPQSTGWFGREFASESERELAGLMAALKNTAAAQCARKRSYNQAHPEELRERIYHELLFGAQASTSKTPGRNEEMAGSFR